MKPNSLFFGLFLAALGVAQAPVSAQIPTITSQPASRVMWAGGNVTFAVTVSGSGPFAYQWRLNGTNLPNNIITTVAGGDVGDGGAATNASLGSPAGVAVDAFGNMFIGDSYNHSIRKVSTNGIITTVTGDGIENFLDSNEGGTSGLAVDASGNLFFAEIHFYAMSDSGRILKVSTNGIITTVAGGGSGDLGDGGAATNAYLAHPSDVVVDAFGNLFIADSESGRIRKVSANGIITTVAGGGTDYPGDGGAATNASLGNPSGVAVDASGNLFISDSVNVRIRRVSINGIITTVAGNGTNGYSGDGGAAINAELDGPSSLAVDVSGNLFISDIQNNSIRKVDVNGTITTVAGYGNEMNVYFGDGGPATNAGLALAFSSGLLVDGAGNLFIGDTINKRVRKVSTNGIITTVAGNGTFGYFGDGGDAINAGFNHYPSSVVVDGNGNLFIADTGNNRVRKVSTNGIITTVAGGAYGYSGDGGAATNAGLSYADGVAMDGAGDLFIVSTLDNRVRKVNTSGIITTVAGGGIGDGGAADNASLNQPVGVAVDASGNLFIADTANNRVRKVIFSGIITTVAGGGTNYPGDGGAATDASLNWPSSVAVDSFGNLFIADADNNRIRKVDSNGVITTVAGSGAYFGSGNYSGDGGLATDANLSYPSGVAVDASGNLFIADSGNERIRKVDVTGLITTVAGNGVSGYSGDGGPATNAGLSLPSGVLEYPVSVAVDAYGNLFIADYENNRIRKVGTNGIISTVAGNGSYTYSGDGGKAVSTGVANPTGVAVDAYGNLFIGDSYNERIRKVSTNGIITTVAGNGTYSYSGDGGGATVAGLWNPTGVAVDEAGNLLIADTQNGRVRRVSTSGIITTVAGGGVGDGGAADNATLNQPSGVVADAFGNLFIADTRNSRIRKVSANGIITTVAGNGILGYSGDGGAATNAKLNGPSAVATDALGDLFVAETVIGGVNSAQVSRIRKVSPNGIITTLAGNGTEGYSGDGGVAANASLSGPYGLAVDASGNLFVADKNNQRVRKIDHTGVITTVAGDGTEGYSGDGGAATNANLADPQSVAVDASGNVFIADSGNSRIRKVTNTQGPVLALNGVSPGDSGDYQVIVTGPSGSVTSSVATLTVASSPITYAAVRQPDGRVTTHFLSIPNSSNVVFSATNLTLPVSWQPVSTNLATADGTWQYTDTNTAAHLSRFFRSATLKSP